MSMYQINVSHAPKVKNGSMLIAMDHIESIDVLCEDRVVLSPEDALALLASCCGDGDIPIESSGPMPERGGIATLSALSFEPLCVKRLGPTSSSPPE